MCHHVSTDMSFGTGIAHHTTLLKRDGGRAERNAGSNCRRQLVALTELDPCVGRVDS